MAEVHPSAAQVYELCVEFESSLRALPYSAYLACLASFLSDLREFFREEVEGPGEDLVDRTIAVITAASAGLAFDADAARLEQQWVDYRRQGDGNTDDLVEVDLPHGLHIPAYTAVLELVHSEYRYDAVEDIGDAAYWIALEADVPIENIDMLRKFTTRVRAAAGG